MSTADVNTPTAQPLSPTQWWVRATSPSDTEMTSWDAMDEKVASFLKLGEDWDGDGAEAMPPEIVEGSRRLAEELRRSGVPAPTGVIPSRSGTVVLEWQLPDRELELEVVGPGEADGLERTNAGGTSQFTVRW